MNVALRAASRAVSLLHRAVADGDCSVYCLCAIHPHSKLRGIHGQTINVDIVTEGLTPAPNSDQELVAKNRY